MPTKVLPNMLLTKTPPCNHKWFIITLMTSIMMLCVICYGYLFIVIIIIIILQNFIYNNHFSRIRLIDFELCLVNCYGLQYFFLRLLYQDNNMWLARQCLPLQLNATSDADSRNVFLCWNERH